MTARPISYRYTSLFLFLALSGNLLLQQLWPEIIPAANGFGFDGRVYAEMVVRLGDMIQQDELSPYYSKRILPSLFIRSAFELFDVTPDRNAIIYAFQYLNFFMLMISALIWVRIANILEIHGFQFWLGALGLFFCFPIAKLLYYYPVITDVTAFTIGCAMAYGTLSRNVAIITVSALLGAFVWPTSEWVGALLIISLIWRSEPDNQRSKDAQASGPIDAFSRIIAYLAVAGTLLLATIALLVGRQEFDLSGRNINIHDFARLITNIPMMMIVAIALFIVFYHIYHSKITIVAGRNRAVVNVIAAGLVLTLPSFIQSFIANPDIPAPGIGGIPQMVFALVVQRVSEGKVLLPVVAHAVYFGPVFLLLPLMWRNVVRSAIALGPGFVIVLLIFVVFSLFSESRFNMLTWPFVVITVAFASRRWTFTPFFKGVLIVLSLVYSRFWLRINQGAWPEDVVETLNQWPQSLYFSHQGPRMNWEFFLIYAVLVAGSLWLMKRAKEGTVVLERDDRPS